MKRSWIQSLLTAIAVALFLAACVPVQVNLTCDLANTGANSSSDSFGIKVYIDGTPSMQGFVSNNNSRYVQTLEKLLSLVGVEPTGLDNQPRSFSGDPEFFRLGQQQNDERKKVQKITRNQYRQAQLKDFYTGIASGLPLLEVSQINAALSPPAKGTNELAIIVTDLYQDEDDTNQIVNSIEKYLDAAGRNGAVGLLGIRSEFNGRVYTEALAGVGEFDYNSRGQALRPFYILLIGQLDEVHFYLDKLQNDLDFSQGIEAVIFSPYRLYSTVARLDRESQQDLNETLAPEQRQQVIVPGLALKHSNLVVNLKDQHIQPLRFKGQEPIELPFQVNLSPIPHVLTASKLATELTSKSFDSQQKAFAPDTKYPSLQQVLALDQVALKENTLSFTAKVQPEHIKADGIYLFEANLKPFGEALSSQSWWKEWNSLPNSKDGTKTHNLELFLNDLKSRTNSLMKDNPVTVGRFCYVIQKQ